MIDEWRAFLAEVRLMIVADPGLAKCITVDGDSIRMVVPGYPLSRQSSVEFFTVFDGELIMFSEMRPHWKARIGYARSLVDKIVTFRQAAKTQGA